MLDEGLITLSEALHSNRTLQYLYLSGNGITPKGAQRFAKYLSHNEQEQEGVGKGTLLGISLGCNRLGNEGVAAIGKALHHHPTLERVELASCGCRQEGARSLADSLVNNNVLRHLSLGFLMMTAPLGEAPNRIGNAGAIALANALQKNRTLVSLDLTHNNIHQEGMKALEDAICGRETEGECSLKEAGMVKLHLDQMGVPLNEQTLERLRRRVSLNRERVGDEDRDALEEFLNPTHLREIASVYRVNGKYKGPEH